MNIPPHNNNNLFNNSSIPPIPNIPPYPPYPPYPLPPLSSNYGFPNGYANPNPNPNQNYFNYDKINDYLHGFTYGYDLSTKNYYNMLHLQNLKII